MKLLCINGSPRKGNSYILLEKFMDGAKSKGHDVKFIDACSIKISPCRECGFCSKNQLKCSINDEMTEIRHLISLSECIALNSPVFFFGISAQLKTLIDRCQPFWALKYIFNYDLNQEFEIERKGFFFSTGGFSKNITFRGGELSIDSFFDALGIKNIEKILVPSMENKGDILEKKEILDKVYSLGKTL